MKCVEELVDEQLKIKFGQFADALVPDTLNQRCGNLLIVRPFIAINPDDIVESGRFELLGRNAYVSFNRNNISY
jgi:hypothetical protein